VYTFEIGPRLSFATAWSTNAVAICHASGLTSIQRVERSRRYRPLHTHTHTPHTHTPHTHTHTHRHHDTQHGATHTAVVAPSKQDPVCCRQRAVAGADPAIRGLHPRQDDRVRLRGAAPVLRDQHQARGTCRWSCRVVSCRVTHEAKTKNWHHHRAGR
jgi:hypothetical protein